MKVLHIFDFDDTLIHSDSSVVITHGNGSTSVLSSDEYATYDELPDDEMDFSDFDQYPQNAEIIDEVFSELLTAISRDGLGSVVILTARSESGPVERFLADQGVKGIEVQAVGSSDPRRKAEYVLSRVLEDGIDLVKVFEDNAKNIREIRKVVRATGEIGLQTHRIVDGSIANVSKIRPKK